MCVVFKLLSLQLRLANDQSFLEVLLSFDLKFLPTQRNQQDHTVLKVRMQVLKISFLRQKTSGHYKVSPTLLQTLKQRIIIIIMTGSPIPAFHA